MEGGFPFSMARAELATIFHLRPGYGLYEHVLPITAVNCSIKCNVKGAARKSFLPADC